MVSRRPPSLVTETTSRKNSFPGLFSAGSRTRSKARLNASAVTRSFDGGENSKSSRRRNVYVSPSDEMSTLFATSGWSCDPAGAFSSG